MTVMSHLYHPHERAVEYEWRGHPFHAYTITYELDPGHRPFARP